MRLFCIALLALAVLVVHAQEYRSFDGSGVSRTSPSCGAARTDLYVEIAKNSFEDDVDTPWNGPPPRSISNELFAGSSSEVRSLSDVHMFFGQFLAHDVVLSGPPHTGGVSMPIAVPTGDPYFDPSSTGTQTIPFTRSEGTPGSGSTRRTVLNKQTAWLDGSHIYGASAERADALRNQTHREYMALVDYGYGLMPPKGLVEMDNDAHRVPDSELFSVGDPRGNENPVLVALHTVFLREHNRWVDIIRADHPEYDAEKLFQEARRYTIAVWQSITINEYIPSTIGEPLPLYNAAEYDDSASACGTGDFYSTCSFRYGHSETNSVILRYDDEDNLITPVLLRDGYFNPAKQEYPIAAWFRGAARQEQQQVDTFIIDDLRNFLFGSPGSGGLDLTSINIQRNRDHGTPFYNDAREHFGLPRLSTFSEINSDERVASILASLYTSPDELDAYVGGLAEEHAGGSLGPLFTASIKAEYEKKRKTDRFYYAHPDAGFTQEEISLFDRTTLSHVLLRNTELTSFPCSAFYTRTEFDCFEDGRTAGPGGSGVLEPAGNATSFLNGDIVVSWSLTADTITITLVAQTDGWVAMALASDAGNMLGADAWAGWVEDDDGTVNLQDYDISARESGCPGVCPDTSAGGRNDLFDISGSQVDGVTTLRFSRRFVTGDSLDQEIVEPESSSVLFAMGGSDGLSYHGSNKVAASINFFTGESRTVAFVDNSADDRLIAHGVMMFICWGVVFPLGIFIARFLKEVPRFLAWWFQIHLIMQYLGVLFLITGFALALEATAAVGHDHFDHVHGILGLITVLLGIFVPAFGQFTAIFWSAGSKQGWFTVLGVRLFPDAVHYVTGYLSPLVSFVTLYYGLYEEGVAWWWYLLLSLWIAFIVVTFFLLLIIQLVRNFLTTDDVEEDESREADGGGDWSDG